MREVRRALPAARIEVLTPDFCGDLDAVARVLDAGPHVFNHNMETVPRLYRRVRPQADYRQSLRVLRFARKYRPDAMTKSGLMVGLGENPPKWNACSRDMRERTSTSQPSASTCSQRDAIYRVRVCDARAIRSVSRLRPLDRLQNGLQRTAGAQFLHGRRGQRASPVRLNLPLALAASLLLILAFPAFDIAVLAPFALAPLLVAMAREPGAKRRFLLGWAAGILYWVGVCYWIEYVLAKHGGMAPWAAWLAFALFSLAKALHMGVFALLAGPLLVRRWAVATVPALWVAIERTHGDLGFAWLALGNAGVDMSMPARLAPYTGVYGISFVFAMMGTAVALVALRRPPHRARSARRATPARAAAEAPGGAARHRDRGAGTAERIGDRGLDSAMGSGYARAHAVAEPARRARTGRSAARVDRVARGAAAASITMAMPRTGMPSMGWRGAPARTSS